MKMMPSVVLLAATDDEIDDDDVEERTKDILRGRTGSCGGDAAEVWASGSATRQARR